MSLGCWQLEDRAVPAKYLWDPAEFFAAAPDTKWSNPNNWRVDNKGEWVVTATAPGTTPGVPDDVEFSTNVPQAVVGQPVGSTDHVLVDIPVTVRTLAVDPSYAKTIFVASPLTIASGAGRGGQLTLSSAGATLAGGPNGGKGTVTIAGGSSFFWSQGRLESLFVSVGGAGGPAASMLVSGVLPAQGTKLSMRDTDVDVVNGALDWAASDILVDPKDGASSRVLVRSGGAFNISAEAKWGLPGGAPTSRFQAANDGTVVKGDSGTSRIVGDFLNRKGVRINAGTLDLAGLAEQGSPPATWEVAAGATVAVTGPRGALQVYDGLIGGAGTVRDDLHLGLDPAFGAVGIPPVGAPTLRAGTADGFETFTVGRDLKILTGGATVRVRVGDDAAGNSRVAVGGNAALAGTLGITDATTPGARNVVERTLVGIARTRTGQFASHAEGAKVPLAGGRFKLSHRGLNGADNDVVLKLDNRPPVLRAPVFHTAASLPGMAAGFPVTVPARLGLADYYGADPDGDRLAVVEVTSGPAHGTLTWRPDGSFVYTPDAGFAGTGPLADAFTYVVADGYGGEGTATVDLRVHAWPNQDYGHPSGYLVAVPQAVVVGGVEELPAGTFPAVLKGGTWAGYNFWLLGAVAEGAPSGWAGHVFSRGAFVTTVEVGDGDESGDWWATPPHYPRESAVVVVAGVPLTLTPVFVGELPPPGPYLGPD